MSKRANIAAIILAAGRSTRMGDVNKLLVDFDGKTMIERTLENVVAACRGAVVVVTGHQSDEITKALEKFEVSFVHNHDYRQGLSTSLKTGLQELDDEVEGALVVLGDMPLIDFDVFAGLINSFDNISDICMPFHDGKQGNPVLWGRKYFQEILLIEGDRGAKELLSTHQGNVKIVDVETDSVLADFDTPADLASL